MIALVFVPTRSTMPSYGGRSAESWLRDVFSTASSGNSQTAAIEAFREMGTNGIVFLVEALNRRDNTWDRFYQRVFAKLPPVLRQKMPRPVYASALASAAILVLFNVRDTAPEQTLPRLARLLSASNPRTRLDAASVLKHYDQNHPGLDIARFRSELIPVLNDENDWTRIEVATVLDTARLGGPELIPALKPALTNSSPLIRSAAQAIVDHLEAANATARSHAP